jgi:hypothetical protein
LKYFFAPSQNQFTITQSIKMGATQSQQIIVGKSEAELEAEAMRRFNIRVKGYSYPHHGSYYQYIEWCRAMYELDCIPEECQYGSAYTPR